LGGFTNLRLKLFAQAVASGSSVSDAARFAGYGDDWITHASYKVVKSEEYQILLRQALEVLAAGRAGTVNYIDSHMRKLVEKAYTPAGAKVSASVLLGRINGVFADSSPLQVQVAAPFVVVQGASHEASPVANLEATHCTLDLPPNVPPSREALAVPPGTSPQVALELAPEGATSGSHQLATAAEAKPKAALGTVSDVISLSPSTPASTATSPQVPPSGGSTDGALSEACKDSESLF